MTPVILMAGFEMFWRRRVESPKDTYDSRYSEGCELLKRKEYPEALRVFQALVAEYPDQVTARTGLAVALENVQEHDRASEEFKQALDLDPMNRELLYNVGWHHAQRGEFNKAEEVFRRLVVLAPDDYDSYFNLGCALIELGAHSEALNAFESAGRLRPRDHDLSLGVARCLAEMRRFTEAVSYLKEAISLFPDDQRLAGLLAECENEMKRE
jgi:tetratricopeptide (TPR) repeat protein